MLCSLLSESVRDVGNFMREENEWFPARDAIYTSQRV
jgi:hypothetical protein